MDNGWVKWLQWPAMAVTVLSVWWVASKSARKRKIGFWLSILSNVLWVLWGWVDGAWAVIWMQVGLAALNIRGIRKNTSV